MNKKYKIILLTWLVFSMAKDQYKQRQALKLMLEGLKDHQEVLEILNNDHIIMTDANKQFILDEIKDLQRFWNRNDLSNGK
jgi:hypothetical protein